MLTKIISTEGEYQKALARLDEIFDAKKGTPAGDELELLSLLIEDYENRNAAIAPPDPIEALRFRMDQMNYTASW